MEQVGTALTTQELKALLDSACSACGSYIHHLIVDMLL